jgi:hypothetical protein
MTTALLAKPGPTTTALLGKPPLTTTAPPRDQAKAELGIAISAISAIILTAFTAHPPMNSGLIPAEFTLSGIHHILRAKARERSEG